MCSVGGVGEERMVWKGEGVKGLVWELSNKRRCATTGSAGISRYVGVGISKDIQI